MAGSTYSVDVSLDTSTPQPPAPLLPLKTRPVALDVNPFYLEQLRTPPAQLDTFNARKARDAARNVGDIVPLMRSSSVKLGLYQENSACYVTLIACDLMLEFAVGTCFTALCFASSACRSVCDSGRRRHGHSPTADVAKFPRWVQERTVVDCVRYTVRKGPASSL